MAKTRDQKKETLEKLAAKLDNAKAVVFATFDKLKVKDNEDLRKKCREQKVDYEVIKKTLLKKALTDKKIEGIEVDSFERGIAVASSQEDEVMPAKILHEFAKDNEALELKSGVLATNEGLDVMDEERIKSLAQIPAKPELLGKMVGSIKAPISGFVNVLQGNLRGLIQVLNGIKEGKE